MKHLKHSLMDAWINKMVYKYNQMLFSILQKKKERKFYILQYK